MLTNKNLMVGNYLRNIQTGRIVIVREVLTTRISIDSDLSLERIKTYTVPINSYEGIPLAPEILETAGFVLQPMGGYKLNHFGYGFIHANYSQYKGVHSIGYSQPDVSIILNFCWNCSHVHQLQNLIFAMTGEELEIAL